MSFLSAMLLAATAEGKIKSILNKKNNRLVFTVSQSGNTTEQTVNFDIMKSWSYEANVVVTENPVEQGAFLNDHRIIKPEKLTIEVGVSNVVNPLDLRKGVLQTARLLFIGTRGAAETPIQATYSQIKLALYNSDTFDIDTPLGKLTNYIIVSVKNRNDNSNYGAFEGTIELQEILSFDSSKVFNTKKSGVNTAPRVNNLSLGNPGTGANFV